MQGPDLLKLKREMYHLEIRRQAIESQFQRTRSRLGPPHYSPAEFAEAINRFAATQELSNEEYALIDAVLDRLQTGDPPPEYRPLVETLLDCLHLTRYPKLAQKASRCFQNSLAPLNSSQADRAFWIYRMWADTAATIDLGVQGVQALATIRQIPSLNEGNAIDMMLQVLADRTHQNYHAKIFRFLAENTRGIQDDSQVIRILRLAAKLASSSDLKIKVRGLQIIENATKNTNNIQFVLMMKVLDDIFDLVAFQDPLVSRLAIMIICNLTFTVDKDETRQLLDRGILDVIYRLFKNHKSYARENAALILSNLMASSFEVLQCILDHPKLIDNLFLVMHHDKLEVRREVYHAWKNFIISCTQQQLLYALTLGLLDFLIEVLYEDDARIVALALESLHSILNQFQGTNYENDVIAYLHKKQVHRQLDKFQHSCHERVFNLVQNIIRDYFDSDFI